MCARPVAAPLAWVIPYGLASSSPACLVLGREGGELACQAWRFGLRHDAGTGT